MLMTLLVTLTTGGQAGLPTIAKSTDTAEVVVDISKIKNQQGKVVVCLFKSMDGFPSEVTKAVARQTVAITGTTARASFQNVVPGDYYLSVFHDENANAKPDRNFVGMPKEGVGLPGEAMKGMRPDFSKALVHIRAGSQQFAIPLRYVL